jgi:hypothetical protein
MATQTVEFRAATGLTIIAKLFAAGSDTEVASVTATEATNRKGTYSAAYTDVVAGEYQLIALNSGIPVASWWVTLTLTTATFGIYSKADTRDINTKALDIQSRIPDALENGRMKASVSGTGSGARTVTITVTLNGTPVEGALIRLTKAAESYLGTTDEDGEEVFNVNDGTWTVAITAANASFDGDELVVNGDETPIYPMTATSFTASSASLVTGYWTCYSHLGVVESGVTITMICKKVPAESGFALDSATRTATSGADGIAQFANLIPGATYQVARGSGQNFMIKVPDDATGTIELNSILGT